MAKTIGFSALIDGGERPACPPRVFHRMVDPPVRANGLRRSDSIDFCVREMFTLWLSGDGDFSTLPISLGWQETLSMPPDWLLATAGTPGELAYREWVGGVAPTRAAWWAFVVGSSDWAVVCGLVAALGVTPAALCAKRLEMLEACRLCLPKGPLARAVNSWISAHLGWPQVLPGVAAVLDGGSCPDCTAALLSIDPRPQSKAVQANAGPIQHLLRKAFPRRCQIRELLRFVSAYWRDNKEVEWFLRCAVFCCLGGFYLHHDASSSPPLAARKALYRVCFHTGPGSLAEWMHAPLDGAALHGMQCTLLVVLQDTVLATVSTTPLQAAVYRGFVDWPAFIGNVHAAATAAQLAFSETGVLHALPNRGARQNASPHPTVLHPIFAPGGDEVPLLTWLRANVARDRSAWDEVIRASGALLPIAAGVPNHRKTGWGRGSQLFDFLGQMRQAGGEACVELEGWAARGFGTHSARHAALAALAASQPRAISLLAVLVEVVCVRARANRSSLPQQTHEKQLAALHLRYDCCPALPPYAGSLVVCLFCCSVKNPTVKNNQGGPRKCTSEALRRQLSSGLGAGGVVYDDDTCRVYCNANTRVDAGYKATSSSGLLRARLCALTPLWVAPVVGYVATIGNDMFTLCCDCACPMKLTKPGKGGGFLTCEACAPQHVIACASCGKGPGCGRPRQPGNWSARSRLVYGGTPTGPGHIGLGPLCGACDRSVASKRRRCFDSTDIICV